MLHFDLADLLVAREATRAGRAAAIRRDAGLSQAEVAEHVGVTAAAISRWESGKRRPRGQAAIRYGRILGELERRSG